MSEGAVGASLAGASAQAGGDAVPMKRERAWRASRASGVGIKGPHE